MKFYDSQKPSYENQKELKLLDVTVYFIFIITMLLLSPLIFTIILRFSNTAETADANKTGYSSMSVQKEKKYSYTETVVPLSNLQKMHYMLIASNVTNEADGILFCREMSDDEREDGAFRIVKLTKDGNIKSYRYHLPMQFVQEIKDKNYIFKDYGDGFIYLSDSENAYLFDVGFGTETITLAETYSFPVGNTIYQAVLSNDKTKMALATEKGLFISDAKMTYIKELISSVETVNGIKTLPKNPVWSAGDDHIYYTLYADGYIKNAGRTPLSLGGNEQFTSLENTNFYVLNDGSIFYYYSTNYQTGYENLFKCGYFNATDKKMTDMIKSKIYYFDIKVSSAGNCLAALSYNGKLKKISIIDIKTKKTIYSSIYEEIYDFAFSPNEKNIIIYGRKDKKDDLRIVEMNWTEE